MTNRWLTAAAVTMAMLGTAAPGVAADLARAPVYKAPPPAAPAWSWTGFYVGVNGGYGWGTDPVSFENVNALPILFTAGAIPTAVNTSPAGGLAGIQLGYNWQWTPNFVLGFETDFDWADIRGSGAVVFPGNPTIDPFRTSAEQKLTALGTTRIRVGYALDHALLYATAGLAYGRTELNTLVLDTFGGGLCGVPGLCAGVSTSQWQVGWAAGVGGEWAFADSWSIRGEYLHYDLGSLTQANCDPAFTCPLINSSVDFRGDIVRGAINYRFK